MRQSHQDDHGHQIGHQDSHGDHPLLDDAQLASPVAGRELRDVGGGDRGVGPDREPDERAGRQQHEGIHGERRQQRADGVDGGVGDEQGLAPEVVGQRPGDERSRAGAQGRTGHQVARPEARQMVRNEVQRRADVGGVVSERETRRRRPARPGTSRSSSGSANPDPRAHCALTAAWLSSQTPSADLLSSASATLPRPTGAPRYPRVRAANPAWPGGKPRGSGRHTQTGSQRRPEG